MSEQRPSLWSPGLWLTSQVGVINPLLDFGILYDDHGAGRQQQLPGAGLVAFAVVFHYRHCVLGTEDGVWFTGAAEGAPRITPHPLSRP